MRFLKKVGKKRFFTRKKTAKGNQSYFRHVQMWRKEKEGVTLKKEAVTFEERKISTWNVSVLHELG